METLWHDLRLATRMLHKSPAFTAVAVITLALGIGANTAIFSIFNFVLLRQLPYRDPERLVVLWEENLPSSIRQRPASPATYLDWQNQSQSFEKMGYTAGTRDSNLLLADGSDRVTTTFASASFFPVMGVEPLIGRTFISEDDDLGEDNGVALINEDLWRRRFGADPNVIGSIIIIDNFNKYRFTVVGVLPNGFRAPGQTDLWLNSWVNRSEPRRSAHWLNVYARLRTGVTVEQASTELNIIQQQLVSRYPAENIGSKVGVIPLLHQTVGDARHAVTVLLYAVALVLLIACVNVANLQLARSVARQKEIAVRAALGASRFRLFRQVFTESVLLALTGGLVGTLLAILGIPLFESAFAAHIPRLAGIEIDATLLAITLAASMLSSLLFGLLPAYQATKIDLNQTLKHGERSASSSPYRSRLRGALVVAEVALALVLLVGAGLLMQSFVHMQRIDLGFNPENVLTAKFDLTSTYYSGGVRDREFFRQLMERVRALPEVQSVGGTLNLPFEREAGGQQLKLELATTAVPDKVVVAATRACTPDYFETLGIPLIEGRSFTERDRQNSPWVLVVNQTFARRYFPNESPLGKRVSLITRDNKPAWMEIVGIVGDVKNQGLQSDIVPEIYSSYWQWPWHYPVLVIRTASEPGALVAQLNDEVKALNTNQNVGKIQTMEELLNDATAQHRMRAMLTGLFAILALVLAWVGIYGVVSYGVTQRTQELGIRIALGAQAADVLRLVVGQAMWFTLSGVAAGLLGSFWLTRLMSTLLYEIQPTDPLTFVGTALLLAVCALVACWLPARRAARVDPILALRRE